MTNLEIYSNSGKTFKQHLIEEISCSFCLGILNEAVMTNCMHLFCKECLKNYLKKNQQCPTCKCVITINQAKPIPSVLANIINRLKKIPVLAYPYNQLIELQHPVELVNLEKDTKKNGPVNSTDSNSAQNSSTTESVSNNNNTSVNSFGNSSINNRSSMNTSINSSPAPIRTSIFNGSSMSTSINSSPVLIRPPIFTVPGTISLNSTLSDSGINAIDDLGNTNLVNLISESLNATSRSSLDQSTNFIQPIKRSRSIESIDDEISKFEKSDSMTIGDSNLIHKSLKQPFLEELSCPICLFTMIDPVMTLCNHLYCKQCITTWLKLDDKSCPVCKKYISNTRSAPRALKRIILKLNALPDMDTSAKINKKRTKIEVICIDQERRPIPKPKKLSQDIPLIILD